MKWKLKDIFSCSNACYKYGSIGHFQRDCVFGNDDDNHDVDDTSTLIIHQMQHSLANSPILKLY